MSRFLPSVRWPLILNIFFFSIMVGQPLLHAADAFKTVRSLLETRQKNVVLQQWELSCAAAALATILRYQYEIPVTERSVALGLINREEYLTDPDLVSIRQGFSFLDLKRYIEKRNLEGVGLGNLELEDLSSRAPIIVPVNFQGYPHFVVFRGLTKNTVLLADPAFGNITMSRKKFKDGWIRYRDVGKVGFMVMRQGGIQPPGALAPQSMELLIIR